MVDFIGAAAELKLASGGAEGEFEGYASVFGVTDSHGDMVIPGAFGASLAQHKAAGTMPTLYIQHGPALGGDPLPAGVWTSLEEDGKGLKGRGRISALDTDYGKRARALVQDGALKGLSIGYRVAANGAAYGKKAGEPKRTLKSLNLIEVSLVTAPSNSHARVDSIKAALESDSGTRAALALAAAIRLQDKAMGGYGYSGAKDQALLMDHLRDAYQALTGFRSPEGLEGWTKSQPAPDAIKSALIEAGMTETAAAEFLAAGIKATAEPARLGDAELSDLNSLLADFRLIS